MDHPWRRLPHVWAEGKRLFLTWHLYGSLPHALYPPPNKQNAGRAFVWMEPRLHPGWTPLLETRAHRATGRGFHPLRRAASAILRPASVRRHGEPCAPARAAARNPQPILTNPKGLHGTRSESVAGTHGPAILAGGILRSFGIGPHKGVH